MQAGLEDFEGLDCEKSYL